MDQYLRKNKIFASTIIGLCVIIIAYIFYSKDKEFFYKTNTDCSKIASSFIKQQKDNILADSWNIDLLQNKYNSKKNSCYGEFRFWSNSGTHFSFSSIYDLATNQELVSDSLFSLLDQKSTGKNSEEIVEEYIKIKKEIFGN